MNLKARMITADVADAADREGSAVRGDLTIRVTPVFPPDSFIIRAICAIRGLLSRMRVNEFPGTIPAFRRPGKIPQSTSRVQLRKVRIHTDTSDSLQWRSCICTVGHVIPRRQIWKRAGCNEEMQNAKCKRSDIISLVHSLSSKPVGIVCTQQQHQRKYTGDIVTTRSVARKSPTARAASSRS
jgi:hypothetical protein